MPHTGGGGLNTNKQVSLVVSADGTGDHLTIASAYTALPATGGIIYIKGAVSVPATVSVSKPVNFIGLGWANTILTLANGVNASVFSFSAGSEGSRLSDMRLNCNKANQTAGSGVSIVSVNDINIDNMYVYQAKYYGIEISGSYHYITNNYVTAGDLTGIYSTGGAASVITGNTVTSNGGSGIYWASIAVGTAIIGNTVASNSFHGLQYFGSGSTVSGNKIYSNSGQGIYVGITTGANYHTRIFDNYIFSNTLDGISNNSVDGKFWFAVITGNNIWDNGRSGISGQFTYSVITNNTLYNNCDSANDTYAQLHIRRASTYGSTYNMVNSNILYSNVANKPKYSIWEVSDALDDHNTFSENIGFGAVTADFLFTGANSVDHLNKIGA